MSCMCTMPVKKYWKGYPCFSIHSIVRFQCDGALKSKIKISVHGLFPMVYVQVRQWGAWKLHPYNSSTQILILIYAHLTITPILRPEISWVLVWLMIVSITITYDQQALLHQAGSDHCSLTLTNNNCLGPASTIVIRNNAWWPQLQQQILTLFFPLMRRGSKDSLWIFGPTMVILWVIGICCWSIIAPLLIFSPFPEPVLLNDLWLFSFPTTMYKHCTLPHMHLLSTVVWWMYAYSSTY